MFKIPRFPQALRGAWWRYAALRGALDAPRLSAGLRGALDALRNPRA
eukprot:gene11138-biopygen9014